MLLVYITCEHLSQAEKIGSFLLSKKLCGCVNILPHIEALFFWPENSFTLEKNAETILLLKTFAEKFEAIEKEVKSLHTYKIPCIIGIPTSFASPEYENWLRKQMGLTK